jgi:hypothetical protein
MVAVGCRPSLYRAIKKFLHPYAKKVLDVEARASVGKASSKERVALSVKLGENIVVAGGAR